MTELEAKPMEPPPASVATPDDNDEEDSSQAMESNQENGNSTSQTELIKPKDEDYLAVTKDEAELSSPLSREEELLKSPSILSEGTEPDPPSDLKENVEADAMPRGGTDPQRVLPQSKMADTNQSSTELPETTPEMNSEDDESSIPKPPLSTIETGDSLVDDFDDDDNSSCQNDKTSPGKIYDAPKGSPLSNGIETSHLNIPSVASNTESPELVPRVEDGARSVNSRYSTASAAVPQTMMGHQASFGYTMPAGMMMMPSTGGGGRRKIRLRLEQDVPPHKNRNTRSTFLGHIRSRSKRMFGSDASLSAIDELETSMVDRGTITVSWYEGTSGIELHEHVRRCVIRKLQLARDTQIQDMRLFDETINPPEEIVLSPYIPDGSHFLLQFSTRDSSDGTSTPGSSYSANRAPRSPSEAPSPHHRQELAGLTTKQLEQLRNQLNALRIPAGRTPTDNENRKKYVVRDHEHKDTPKPSVGVKRSEPRAPPPPPPPPPPATEDTKDETTNSATESHHDGEEEDDLMYPDDPIAAQLQQITKLLVEDRQKGRHRRNTGTGEKRQVIFVLANYFVVFLAFIAISAEIQARLPDWLASMETHMKNVQDCAADQEALFRCVSNGDFAGLIASILVWLSRSVVTKRIFLLGFDTPKKLWTVVYESLVTAVCWGFSYMFIRRGMNPDTRRRFIQKYWKDAVYGSLAGFNAAFMKQILKNLIPQEAVEDALRERQLKILSWIPSFA